MSEEVQTLDCKYAGRCGGCPWILTPLPDQLRLKVESAGDVFPTERIQILSAGIGHLRDRVDLTIMDGKIGLFSLSVEPAQSKELLDLDSCPMMTPSLENWFKEFRQNLPPIEKGSVRLRVGPNGQKGAWLDFSNEDVAKLFEEKQYLNWLASKAVVEIGQRKKPLYFDNIELDRPRLDKEPKILPWFESYDLKDQAYPIFGVVGGFTQAGMCTNKKLVQEVLRQVQASSQKNWVEAFCGNGNFSVPLSRFAESVFALEVEENSLKALREGMKASNIQNIFVQKVDLNSSKQTTKLIQDPLFSGDYGLLVDPPRSGMMKLIDQISLGLIEPKTIVYVSCFTESFKVDVQKLNALGYVLDELSLVDQFPNSPHVEWVGRLTKTL